MNVVLIMAKEGSQGLPGKNIWRMKDRTLLSWTIADAKRSKSVDAVFVSTNGKETAAVARKAGAEVIMRENELAKNEKFLAAVDHSVTHLKDKHRELAIIAIPQCVVPFRDPDIFDRCIDFLLKNPDYDSAVTVRRVGFIPEALMRLSASGDVTPYFPHAQSSVSPSRQDSAGYEIDHAVECFTYRSWQNRDQGMKPWTYLGRKIKGLEQRRHNPNCFVDVHTLNDVRWLEFIVEHLGFAGMSRDLKSQER